MTCRGGATSVTGEGPLCVFASWFGRDCCFNFACFLSLSMTDLNIQTVIFTFFSFQQQKWSSSINEAFKFYFIYDFIYLFDSDLMLHSIAKAIWWLPAFSVHEDPSCTSKHYFSLKQAPITHHCKLAFYSWDILSFMHVLFCNF